ncbi:metallophosphoesterase [Haliangium sp.]|uniref:metallophosphoesterase n=1 Tax=Haliangium sp. TaxID=2663208 RepID=UPI003D138E48
MVTLHCRYVVVVVATVAAASACGNPTPPPPSRAALSPQDLELGDVPSTRGNTSKIIFLADSQIHNATGGSLKSLGRVADRVSNVAIRPPKLNLLAPLALRALVRSARENAVSDLMVVLGDVANIACSSELEAFENELRLSAESTPWLAAHGNHDSFMMGVFQAYERDTARRRDSEALFSDEDRECAHLPPCLSDDASGSCCAWRRYSGWSTAEASAFAYDRLPATSWPQACASPTGSVPANKLVWMAWYLRHLTRMGVEVSLSEEMTGEDGESFRIIRGKPGPNSPLSSRDYRVTGRWVSPRSAADGYHQERWWSYLVQSFDATPGKRVILIDTSADGGLNPTLWNLGGAGRMGRMNYKQSADIEAHVKAARGRKQAMVVAGHYPFKGLSRTERHRLAQLDIAEYISAHTHTPTTYKPVANTTFQELNIGSTTDWPMEVVVRDFSIAGPAGVEIFSLAASRASLSKKYPLGGMSWRSVLHCECGDRCDYASPPWKGLVSRMQACAHRSAALEIMAFLDGSGSLTWSDDPGEECPQQERRDAATDVAGAVNRLSEPMPPEKESMLLCLARAASESEGVQE